MIYSQQKRCYDEKNLKFKEFLEHMEERYESIKADIPMPPAVKTLSELFSNQGASLFAVGGVIRDYLFSKHHGGKFSPKDVDLATEIPPNEVLNILNSPEALAKGVKSFPKGEAFGVISAIINKEEYEIATFREDGQYTDGRRPDSVIFSTPAKDAQRRDLTYNALFYDINNKEIRDYNLDGNGDGQGFQDIKNLVARPVGNARDRFKEDKLRIPRLIRFFSRFNPGEIMHHLDKNTLDAIQEFKNLAGVSPERISAEFISGLQKSAKPTNYIKNYEVTGLLPAVFPGLSPNLKDIENIGNTKNIKAVLAWIFRDGDPQKIRSALNRMKYPNNISDGVGFLIRVHQMDESQIYQILKQRDIYKQLKDPLLQTEAKKDMEKDIMDFAHIAGTQSALQHFLNYQSQIKSQDFMHLKGKEISDAMSNAEKISYLNSRNANLQK